VRVDLPFGRERRRCESGVRGILHGLVGSILAHGLLEHALHRNAMGPAQRLRACTPTLGSAYAISAAHALPSRISSTANLALGLTTAAGTAAALTLPAATRAGMGREVRGATLWKQYMPDLAGLPRALRRAPVWR